MRLPVPLLQATLCTLLGCLGLVGAPAAQTHEFATLATISATLGVNTNRLCVGEASRQDIGCPSYAPSVNSSGLLTATTLATGGLTVTGATSLNTVSATSVYAGENLQLTSPTTPLACTASSAGSLRYNSPTTTLELCTGSGWQPMGVGIPAGTISAFASTTCPVGWSEYTPARGRFLRGIDNGAGNDPDGTRTPGDVQIDLFKNHSHFIYGQDTTGAPTGATSNEVGNVESPGNPQAYYVRNSDWTGGAETRPKNVAVTYCQFNGTSNGWNNPLSGGGSTTNPAGNNGQVQFNSGDSFGASAALTFDNATSRLSVTNISSTALEVTSRISTSALQLGTDASACTLATVGTIRRDPASGRFQICRL